MARRLKLHEELTTLTNMKVYFQPPENVKIQYPCIVYELGRKNSRFANDKNYIRFTSYTLTVITSNPDDDTADKIMNHFTNCAFDRQFKSDNLYHNVLTLYY